MLEPTPPNGRGLLPEFLAHTDAPCPSCGYNLRGLAGSVCPECSQSLVLRVGLAEPRLALWVAGLVGLASGAGFSGLLLVFFLSVVVPTGRGGRPWAFVLATVPGFVIESALLAAWIHSGPRIRRHGKFARICLVAGCWTLTLLNLVVFSRLAR